MAALTPQIAQFLNSTLSPDGAVVGYATEALDRLSSHPDFPFSLIDLTIGEFFNRLFVLLLLILILILVLVTKFCEFLSCCHVGVSGGENQGLRIAAATYLKNFARRNLDGEQSSSKIGVHFRNRLVQALLQAEPVVLKVLVESVCSFLMFDIMSQCFLLYLFIAEVDEWRIDRLYAYLQFRIVISNEFVKENSWPELVPELQSVIQHSNLSSEGSNSQWNTVNALTVLQAITRPFQYFLNPSDPKEPVPPQLEVIAKEILVPILMTSHHMVVKVRSYMPSPLILMLPSFCLDLFGIMDSLSFKLLNSENALLRLKTVKRIFLIFSSLVTRHRKHFDKLIPNIINCAYKVVTQSPNVSKKRRILTDILILQKMDFFSERIISLAFDVISRVLETGQLPFNSNELFSPHFSVLLDSAIFPALSMNQKDINEWEEDPDEYIRKNLPSDLDDISGWKEDLFTARKSAINLLGVISISKGPPMTASSNGSATSMKRKKGDRNRGKVQRRCIGELLVLPYLSKFPVPTGVSEDATSKFLTDYYGVLMAFGGLQDFLGEQDPTLSAALIKSRVLPLYSSLSCSPYLIATANWVLGELVSCLPEEMNADVYSSLLKAFVIPNFGDISCYPVRVSAAGAVAELLENDYLPPEWLPLLQAVVNRTDCDDDNESSVAFQLLSTVVEAGGENVAIHIPSIVSAFVGTISKHIPPIPEPWPQTPDFDELQGVRIFQVVERGFSALAVMAQTLENRMLEEVEENELCDKWETSRATTARAFSILLQQAWLPSVQRVVCFLPILIWTSLFISIELCGTVAIIWKFACRDNSTILPHPSCLDDASTLLLTVMRSVSESSAVADLKVTELLIVWSEMIAEWNAWEEVEDLIMFKCIRELVNLQRRCDIKYFFVGQMPSPPAPPVPHRSIIEGVGAFVSEAMSQYPSAIWRGCTCVHAVLHVPRFSFETEGVKQSLVIAFTRASFCQFNKIQSKPSALWKPLLLAISSCYMCYPDMVEKILEKEEHGFMVWGTALVCISKNSFEPALSGESEMKLAGCKRNDQPRSGLLESEDDEHEETEEEFLDRYAKEAAALEDGLLVEEGDADVEDQELELGALDEVDEDRAVLSLIERYNQTLIIRNPLLPELVTAFLNAYPECSPFFRVKFCDVVVVSDTPYWSQLVLDSTLEPQRGKGLPTEVTLILIHEFEIESST
ncbi:hypothetical protein Sjap_007182 [Stephania japonica]|uniref:Uncharacterized protein n=1 Tax=Stephania japonica TaxID=461633 RepID=A0AAP0JM53_9MAGN